MHIIAPALGEDTSNGSISRGHESERGPIGCRIGLQNLPQKGSRKLPRFRPMLCHDAPSQQLPIHRGHLDYLVPSRSAAAICAGSGDQTARGMKSFLRCGDGQRRVRACTEAMTGREKKG